MIEMFTPEVITVAIVALTASILFIFLMFLITIASLFRVKTRLLVMRKGFLELKEDHASLRQINQTINTHTACLDESAEKIVAFEPRLNNLENQISSFAGGAKKITSIERHLDQLYQKITENYDQLTGLASKLNEHDTLLGQAGQLVGKEVVDFKHAVRRIHILEEEFQGLKAFRQTFEQTRDQILKAFNGTSVEMAPRNIPSPEERGFKEEAVISTEPKKNEFEELYKSRMQYHYP